MTTDGPARCVGDLLSKRGEVTVLDRKGLLAIGASDDNLPATGLASPPKPFDPERDGKAMRSLDETVAGALTEPIRRGNETDEAFKAKVDRVLGPQRLEWEGSVRSIRAERPAREPITEEGPVLVQGPVEGD